MASTSLVILALTCLSLTAAAVIQSIPIDKTLVKKQQEIFDLLWHPDQPTVVMPELEAIANSWNIEEHKEDYHDKNAVIEFVQRWEEGLLPRGEVFSLAYVQQRAEAYNLFRLFWSANDYTTFYNTAVWARFNVNEVMFTYAFVIAVMQRPDTQDLKVPPLYEMIPTFFFDTEIMEAAKKLKMAKTPGIDQEYMIHVNHTKLHSIHDTDPEAKMHYFINDIGLNMFFFYIMNEYPVFMTSHELNVPENIRGELYLFNKKQLLTRYYLERLSNGLGEIQRFDWNRHFPVGYHPTLSMTNGVAFPERKPWSLIQAEKYLYVQEVQDVESRIWMAINSGHILDSNYKPINIYTPEGLNILGNIIEGNADSYNQYLYNSFMHLATMALGSNVEPLGKYPIHPSVLDYYSTSLRDPAYYMLVKKVMYFYMQYKSHLPAYTHEELVFDGVKVEHISVDKLTTFFEDFYAQINNSIGVFSHEDAVGLDIKATQSRLNHKPFNYRMKITSDKNTKAMVRVFLGPKYDEKHRVLNITDNYMNFVEMDRWDVKLKIGSNLIGRSSKDSIYVAPNQMPAKMYMEKMKKSVETGESFTWEKRRVGFPENLLLPKGTRDGMQFQMFVHVGPYDEAQVAKYESPVWGTVHTDGKPMGYPMDRPVYGFNFTVPNMYFKDVTIYHKELEELNLTI